MDQKPTFPIVTVLKFAFALVVSLAIIFFVIPIVFAASSSFLVAIAALVTIVPVAPALQITLMEDKHFRFGRFVMLYIHHFVALFFEFLYLAIFVPFMLIYLVLMVNGIFLFVIALMFPLYAMQHWLGIDIARPLTQADIQSSMPYFLGSLGIETAAAIIVWVFHKRQTKASDWVADKMAAILDDLKYLRKDDPDQRT